MSPATITVTGARGGHGTTTVATALAILAADHGPTRLVSADAAALLALPGMPEPGMPVPVTNHLALELPGTGGAREHVVTVIDAGATGSAATAPTGEPSFVVLRGPCYLGLRHLVTRAVPPPAGIILLSEPGRSLTRRDVEDVVGVPVMASVVQHPTVARTIDAGLLLDRLHRLPQFRELWALAQRLFDLPADSQPAVA
ncbi:MAG: hypothetical protein AB1679_24045 [Actinomycetota bacterium]